MRKLGKILFRFLLVLILLTGVFAACGFGYVQMRMQRDGISYSEAVEDIILDLVPENGITIKGRTYGYWSVKNFLDEIRYDPYNYIHKDHHCVLQYATDSQIHLVVNTLRIIMGCS